MRCLNFNYFICLQPELVRNPEHIMSSKKLDRKDVDTYGKYLVFKSTQVIVQSRTGEKLNTQSKPFSSVTDWFNLSIRDNADVLAEIKKIYGNRSLSNSGQPVCLEISLKTAEGEEMGLETWWIEMVNSQEITNLWESINARDHPHNPSLSIYNRMSTLLKSVIAVSHATPAYQLSRRQSPDNYILHYKIYLGKPVFGHLGEGYQKQLVGHVLTPFGRISTTLAYRTKLLLSPQNSQVKDIMSDVVDDHYSSEKVETAAGNSDVDTTSRGTSTSKTTTQRLPEKNDKHGEPEEIGCFDGAFVSKDLTVKQLNVDDIPFEKLLECATVKAVKAESSKDTDDISSDVCRCIQPMVEASSDSASNHSSCSAPDDFVMLELKAPFGDVSETEDLGNFYRECKVAPPLSLFQQSTDLHEMLNSITDQLAEFEANARGFDDFVNSITEADF